MHAEDRDEQLLTPQDIAALATSFGQPDKPSAACTYFLNTLAANSSEHDVELALRHANLCEHCRPLIVSLYTTDEAFGDTA